MNPLEVALNTVNAFIETCFEKGYIYYVIMAIIVLIVLVILGKI